MTVVVYDRGDRSVAGAFWGPGVRLYRWLGKARGGFGASTLTEALEHLAKYRGRLRDVEVWCHAEPGAFLLGGERMHIRAARNHRRLREIGERLAHNGGTFWVRGCSAFAGPIGHAFAGALADSMNCRVAGHTYEIGAVQSGLHTLLPGEQPSWSPHEGTGPSGYGTAHSSLSSPNTITALANRIPRGW